jgi:acetate kinase
LKILCLDGGSSSLKYALFDCAGTSENQIFRGEADAQAGLARVLSSLEEHASPAPDAIGHRIVFGGPDHTAPTLVTAAVLAELTELCDVDPVHLAPELDLVRTAMAAFPHASPVACFDTAFHSGMPSVAQRVPLPTSVGPLVRRYGYHGLSYEYIVSVLGVQAEGRVLIAHLGSGASMAAVRDGRPVDTTMGFSPLGGLMMGTRPGDIDPGIALYLMRGGMGVDDLTDLFYRRSGLLGVSGSSGSMKELELAAASDQRARDALDLFDYQACKHAGALTSALGGLDLLVFTGGIGEHSPRTRKALGNGLAHLGVRIDPEANERTDPDVISAADSRVLVRVIPTDENRMIARHAYALLARGG